MKRFKIGQTEVGQFKCARDAAVFHFGSEAVLMLCTDMWMFVGTGEMITVKEV